MLCWGRKWVACHVWCATWTQLNGGAIPEASLNIDNIFCDILCHRLMHGGVHHSAMAHETTDGSGAEKDGGRGGAHTSSSVLTSSTPAGAAVVAMSSARSCSSRWITSCRVSSCATPRPHVLCSHSCLHFERMHTHGSEHSSIVATLKSLPMEGPGQHQVAICRDRAYTCTAVWGVPPTRHVTSMPAGLRSTYAHGCISPSH